MNSKNIITALVTAVSLASNAQDESQYSTETLVTTIKENIAYTLREPCSNMEGVQLLNCRLRTSNTTDASESDADIRKKVSERKNNLNFFLANGLGLPVSIVTQSSEFTGSIPGVPVIEKQILKMNFLPDHLQTSIGVQRISIKYNIPF